VRRLLAAALIAVTTALGVAQLVPERQPAQAELAGTWLCLTVEQTRTGLCLDDPMP
jgi:hypothetical protein